MIYDSAIVPLIPLSNRQQKRMFERDAIRVVEPLEYVNTMFIHQLFDDKCKASYNALFNTYQEMWLNTIDDLVNTKQFSSVGIDKLWFQRQYAPYDNTKFKS